MSEMQAAGRKENSAMDNLIIMNTIIMCYVQTSTVNSIGEEVKYSYGKINIRMPVFMDDIATAGKAEHIRKGIKNCTRMEKEKKISFGLKKTIYMIVKTGREEEKRNQTVKAGRIQRTDKCKYLGMTISTDGQLTEHIKEPNSRCDIIN